ncbi:hypothetical protein C7S18_12190 [Ahniella affigens]|uniref:Phage head morphogenesis domain-containing protein n=1 Tax=Ahniella affigens TaxID=2021234 RepID=A0A2P1PSV8_9GAMM|nr:phage minor head protein [Ahniella affigens]AVP97911.1 hypothetical protein C7S18_12190 [Ahniella affigens]
MAKISAGLKSPFPQQLAFFRRKVNVPTATWTGLWRGDHSHGFMVAGVARSDLLESIRQAVGRGQAGQSFDAFKRDFRKIVAAAGWEPKGGTDWRARVIYDTNIRQAFNAGRYAQLTDPDMLAVRPCWVYQHSPESKWPRPLHLSWDRVTLRADDPWWKTHMPMNGWGCKCRVRAVSRRDIEREGLTLRDSGPDDGTRQWTDKTTGEVHDVPNGIDPGFDYSPGEQAASMPAAAAFGQRILQMPPTWRGVALRDAQTRQADYFQAWPDQVERMIDGGPAGYVAPAGFLRASTLSTLETRGVPVQSTLLAASDDAVRSSVNAGLQRSVLDDLPRALASNSTAVFLDLSVPAEPAIVFALLQPDGQWVAHAFATSQQGRVAAIWFSQSRAVSAETLRRLVWLEGPKP